VPCGNVATEGGIGRKTTEHITVIKLAIRAHQVPTAKLALVEIKHSDDLLAQLTYSDSNNHLHVWTFSTKVNNPPYLLIWALSYECKI